jgi:phosphoribosylpyrophosphate synthetase
VAAEKQLVILGSNLGTAFRAYFNRLAAQPDSNIELLPPSIGAFNGNRPRANQEAFAELWYKAPPEDYEAHTGRIEGRPITVIQSLGGASGMHIEELMAIRSLLTEHKAGPVTAFLPYAPYGRQDKLEPGRIGSIQGKHFPIRLARDFAKIATVEMHSKQAEEFYFAPEAFGPGNSIFLSSTPLFADDLKKRGFTPENTVILAPDGADKPGDAGQRRAHALAAAFHGVAGVPAERENKWLAKLSKVRTPGAVAGTNDAVLTWDEKNDVAGKRCVIVDDVGDSLGTILDTARLLAAHGALSVDVYLSHQGGDEDRLEERILKNKINGQPVINSVTFTDTIPGIEDQIEILAGLKHDDRSLKYPDIHDRLHVLTTAPLFAQLLKP